jgi:hypothetical protein
MMQRILLALLMLPAIFWLLLPSGGSLTLENRNRAAFPSWSSDTTTIADFLKGFDAYVADNIGLRDQLIEIKTNLDLLVNGPSNSRVIAGEDGWLFYNAPYVVNRNSGAIFLPERVENMVKYVEESKKLATTAGVKAFLAMPVPNSHAINGKHLPSWARPQMENPRTEQRAITEKLKAAGMMVSDPFLLFEKYDLDKRPLYFRRDTHWNDFGAYIAFYDAMMQFNLQNAFPQPESILKGYEQGEYYGVLDQFLGFEKPAASEPLPILDRSSFDRHPEVSFTETNDHVSMDSYEVTYNQPGPRLLVIGDSFSYSFFRRFWGSEFSAVHWSHNRYGKYDRTVFERFKPDYVIFEFVDWEIPNWGPL